MTPPSTAEVMEALRRIQDRNTDQWSRIGHLLDEDGRRTALVEGRVLAILEKYAPEMVQREAEEQSGDRKVRVTFTAEEARALRWPGVVDTDRWRAFERASDKLDAALKSLDPPELLERADREDDA